MMAADQVSALLRHTDQVVPPDELTRKLALGRPEPAHENPVVALGLFAAAVAEQLAWRAELLMDLKAHLQVERFWIR